MEKAGKDGTVTAKIRRYCNKCMHVQKNTKTTPERNTPKNDQSEDWHTASISA